MSDQSVDLAFFNAKTFTLTAVDSSTMFDVLYSSQGAGLAFCLDGVIYAAIENPDDGYRSSLDRIAILPPETKLSTPLTEPHQVLARAVDRGQYGAADLVEFIDLNTGKTVIRIGTDNTDDYYPSFVGEFDPLALSGNQSAESIMPIPAAPEAKP